MKHYRAVGVVSLLLVLFVVGRSANPLAPSTPSATASRLVYDAPVTLTIRNGALLPGTTIAYGGKTSTGAARVLIAGLDAAKQIGDTLDWQGAPAPNTNVKLNTRVISFDDKGVNLVGTAHIEVENFIVQPGNLPATAPMEFNAPVTYSLAKNASIPGSNVAFVAASSEGAQFSGIEGYPYRKTLDSLQYTGQLNSKVFLKLDLRVLNFSESGVVLGGTANLKIEAQ
ncbi:MAG: hypothetical protein HY782_13490 [Chloroflexi bacterium]|nr:hypothetical protein [Chloroflexota bacterium]